MKEMREFVFYLLISFDFINQRAGWTETMNRDNWKESRQAHGMSMRRSGQQYSWPLARYPADAGNWKATEQFFG